MATKVGTADIIRVLGTYSQKELEAKYGAEMAAVIMALSQSAWAANNSVNVGMAENAEVLNAMLAQPGTEQIYTTQPAWTFVEDDESVAEGNRTRYQLGSTATIGNVTYPIPSLIYDTDGNPHVVFPVWQASGSFQTKYVNAAGQVSDTAQTGFTEKKIFVGSYGFAPMTIEFKKNCNYFGGNLDGFAWQEVEGNAYTPLEGDMHLTFRTENAVKVGTWCKFTDENSKVYYGYVSAVIPDGDYESVTIIGVGFESDGSEITKVELYKPV